MYTRIVVIHNRILKLNKVTYVYVGCEVNGCSAHSISIRTKTYVSRAHRLFYQLNCMTSFSILKRTLISNVKLWKSQCDSWSCRKTMHCFNTFFPFDRASHTSNQNAKQWMWNKIFNEAFNLRIFVYLKRENCVISSNIVELLIQICKENSIQNSFLVWDICVSNVLIQLEGNKCGETIHDAISKVANMRRENDWEWQQLSMKIMLIRLIRAVKQRERFSTSFQLVCQSVRCEAKAYMMRSIAMRQTQMQAFTKEVFHTKEVETKYKLH